MTQVDLDTTRGMVREIVGDSLNPFPTHSAALRHFQAQRDIADRRMVAHATGVQKLINRPAESFSSRDAHLIGGLGFGTALGGTLAFLVNPFLGLAAGLISGGAIGSSWEARADYCRWEAVCMYVIGIVSTQVGQLQIWRSEIDAKAAELTEGSTDREALQSLSRGLGTHQTALRTRLDAMYRRGSMDFALGEYCQTVSFTRGEMGPEITGVVRRALPPSPDRVALAFFCCAVLGA